MAHIDVTNGDGLLLKVHFEGKILDKDELEITMCPIFMGKYKVEFSLESFNAIKKIGLIWVKKGSASQATIKALLNDPGVISIIDETGTIKWKTG